MKIEGVIFLLYLIIPSECGPIIGSNIDIATCNCQAYQSCKWSRESIKRITSKTQFPGERQLFKDNICNKETQFVWCCRDGNGEEVVPTIDQLAILENQISTTTTTTTTTTATTTTSGEQLYAKIPIWLKEAMKGSSRIVGGNRAPAPIPWQVHVHFQKFGRQIGCGGTILDKETILSAAHCFYPLSRTNAGYIEAGIRLEGDLEGQKIDIKEIILHPLYNESREVAKFDHDIALLKLKEPLTFNANVKPARLPDSTLNPELRGQVAIVSGWGKISSFRKLGSQDLRFVFVPILEVDTCVNLNYLYTPSNITSNMICAGDLTDGGVDSCKGDSGGPLVIPKSDSDDTAIVYGIVSWGRGCGLEEGPGIYTRVSNYNSWIQGGYLNEPKNTSPAPPEPRSNDESNVPVAIKSFYDKILSNLGTHGRNLTLINEVMDDDWKTIPDPMDSVKGLKFGLGAGIRDFVAIMMPDLKYERKHTFVINKNLVAVVCRISATIIDVPPRFTEFPMFPGIEPKKLKGKYFSTMALDVHILDKGKIRRTWHAEDWTLALDEILETGRDVGSLDWPVVGKGDMLTEVPHCIYNFYDKILSDPNGGGQNNTLLAATMHRDAIVSPGMSVLGVVGTAGLKVITRFFGDVMPDIKYERQRMWIHEDKVVVLSKVSATNVKEPQRGFNEIPSFPGVDPKKLFGKKFETLGISVHRILDGKIKQTYHIDEWQLAVAQMLSDRPAPDFDFFSDRNF